MRTMAILISAFLSSALYAQVDRDFTGTLRAVNKEKESSTIGTPYVFEDFMPGYVYFSDSTRSTERMMNYDCYNNEAHYLDGENTFFLDTGMIDHLEFRIDENTSSIFKKVYLEGKSHPVFLNILYDEKSTLYKRYYKEFRESDVGRAYGGSQRYDEYIDRSDYYITFNGEDIQPFRPRKKNILKLMVTSGKQIEDFLKKEKIDLKSESDLVRLLGYYDSLSTQSQ